MPKIYRNQAQLTALVQNWFAPGAATDPSFAVVVDIGQGNCNVVFNATGLPVVYYDLGGGWGGSQFTYPFPHPTYCFHAASRYMLSHWDNDHCTGVWEHIAGGAIDNTDWLVPAQDKPAGGAPNAEKVWRNAFMKSQRDGESLELNMIAALNLYAWPDEDPANVLILRAQHGRYRVIKVSGRDSNNHALALRVENPNVGGQYFLLTGDATYHANTFDHGADGACVGLVASHHGSEVSTPADIPTPLAGAQVLIAYSFGWGNAYGHPNQDNGIVHYEGQGWVDDFRMDTAGAEVAARFAGPRGNVGLRWPADALGAGVVAAPHGPLQINRAAVALIAAAAAEIELVDPGLAEGPAIAVAAAYQAACEVNAPLVAAAMIVPALQAPPQTLVQVAATQGATHAALTAALNAAPAAAADALTEAGHGLPRAVTDATMFAAAMAARDITSYSRDMVDALIATDIANGFNTRLSSQGKMAADSAFDCAYDPTTIANARAAVPVSLAQTVVNCATSRDAHAPPSLPDVLDAIARGVSEAYGGRLGATGGGNPSQQPYYAAYLAAQNLGAVRNDVRTTVAAVAALSPSVPINPKAVAPNHLATNESAKRVARVGATAALVGQALGAAADAAARAGAAAARVVLAAAYGAPLVGCHRHPRTCAGGPCSLSVHYCSGMFKAEQTVYAGNGAAFVHPGGDGGQASLAQLRDPGAIAYDQVNYIVYVIDRDAHRVRAIDLSGVITTVAGTNQGYSGDTAPATNAQLDTPLGIAHDPVSNLLYIADTGNHRVRVVDIATGQIDHFAGNGTQGDAGDGALATLAELDAPVSLALDIDWNLLILDQGTHCVRKVDITTGLISTIGANNVVNAPSGMVFDDIDGNRAFISEPMNHLVWSLDLTSGVYAAVAGTAGTAGFSGDNGLASAAQLSAPDGLAIDGGQILYIADVGNHRVRRVDLSTGRITTLMGDGNTAFNAAQVEPLQTSLDTPSGLAVDTAGRTLFVADSVHRRVRRGVI